MRNLVVLLALLVLGSGCHTIEAREPIQPSPGARASGPIGVSVRRDYEPSTAEKPPSGRYSPAVDAVAIRERASALLKDRGTAGGAGPALTLEAEIVQANVKYEAQTGVFPLKIFFTIFFFPFDVPNYFIDSDRFALTLNARWRLLEKGQLIAEGTAQGKQSGIFGDLSRGWYFVGYLRMPSPLKIDEWQEIAQELVPGAQDALADSLVMESEKALLARKGP